MINEKWNSVFSRAWDRWDSALKKYARREQAKGTARVFGGKKGVKNATVWQ